MILISNPSPTQDSTSTWDPVTSWINIAGGSTLYHCEAGVEANNLLQSDPGLEQWLYRNLPSGAGRARVLPIKTTPIIVSDFISSDGTEMSFIPLRSWHRGQWSRAIRLRIGAVVVEESAIELWVPHGTIYKDNPHNGQRVHRFWCDKDVLYTTA